MNECSRHVPIKSLNTVEKELKLKIIVNYFNYSKVKAVVVKNKKNISFF